MQYRQMFDPAMKNEWDDEDGISPETEKKDKLIKHCLLLPPTNDQKEYAKKKKSLKIERNDPFLLLFLPI